MDRRLIDYLPPVLKEYVEFQALMGAEQTEAEYLWNAADRAFQDFFLAELTENGIQRWESILQIIPYASDSLSERRTRIRAKLSEQLPFTLPMLHAQLQALCGPGNYVIALTPSIYLLEVKIALVSKSNFKDVEQLLEKMVPANIKVELSLLYNRYEQLSELTHAGLAERTHKEIREEVIEWQSIQRN